jgi:hypothetical protein
MRLLAISLESADTVQSAATHSDMISPKYIISFNYNNNERAVVEADRSRGQSYEEKLKSANNSLRFMQEPIIFGGYILFGPHTPRPYIFFVKILRLGKKRNEFLCFALYFSYLCNDKKDSDS